MSSSNSPAPSRPGVAELSAVVRDLPDQELKALLFTAKRLLDGVKVYGPFNLETDKRNFYTQIAEELADAGNYHSAIATSRLLVEALTLAEQETKK